MSEEIDHAAMLQKIWNRLQDEYRSLCLTETHCGMRKLEIEKELLTIARAQDLERRARG